VRELDPEHDRAGEMVIICIALSQPDVAREACTPARLTLSPWWWAAKPQPAGRKGACAAPVRHSACWNIVNQSPTMLLAWGSPGGFLTPHIQRSTCSSGLHITRSMAAQRTQTNPIWAPSSHLSASLEPPFIPKPPRSSLSLKQHGDGVNER
jgi:hypothetical protein